MGRNNTISYKIDIWKHGFSLTLIITSKREGIETKQFGVYSIIDIKMGKWYSKVEMKKKKRVVMNYININLNWNGYSWCLKTIFCLIRRKGLYEIRSSS